MKGTECRLNLLKLLNHIDTIRITQDLSKKVVQMLVCLAEIQKALYSTESQRSSRLILRAINQTFLFGVLATELFADPKSCYRRSMFGMPFHAITAHLGQMIRLVNGRSIVAEAAERQFNKAR